MYVFEAQRKACLVFVPWETLVCGSSGLREVHKPFLSYCMHLFFMLNTFLFDAILHLALEEPVALHFVPHLTHFLSFLVFLGT